MSDEEKKRKKRAAAAAVAVATAGSVVVGGLFTDPTDLLTDDVPTPIVATLDDGSGNDDDGTTPEDEDGVVTEMGLRDKLRARILALPLWVRLTFILPFWVLGWGVSTIATAVWSAVLSPLMSSALGWVVLIAALVGAFGLAAKAIFPDMPWRKVFNKRSVLAVILFGLALGAADLLLPVVWTDYHRISAIVRLVGSLLIVGGVTTAFAVRTHKKRMAAIAASEPPEAEAEEILKPLSQEEILAMADAVGRNW